MKMNNLFLRTCKIDGTSYGGFHWNLEIGGVTEAPDWNQDSKCGHGLHGLLHGKGQGAYLDWRDGALWVVCEALGPIVDLQNKIKTSKAKTLFVGNRKDATDYLIAAGCNPAEVVGAYITQGNYSTVTGGDYSTVIGENYSTVTGAYNSTVTGRHRSTVTGGNYSTVTGGNYSTVTGRHRSTVTGGNYSTVTGGNYSTVTGRHRSTVTGGDHSTVTGGNYSTVTGGQHSLLSVFWKDITSGRRRVSVAYVGEDGIEPNVKYKLDDSGKFMRA
jgi:hypothetical protein